MIEVASFAYSYRGMVGSQLVECRYYGADVNAKAMWGSTPLNMAVRYGGTEVCQLLLEKRS